MAQETSGYWRRKATKGKDALHDIFIENQSVDSVVTNHPSESLQDIIIDKTLRNQEVEPNSEVSGNFALKDTLITQHAALIGLFPNLTRSASQDIIVSTIQCMGELGRDSQNQT
jgi:hypothetical protein